MTCILTTIGVFVTLLCVVVLMQLTTDDNMKLRKPWWR